MKEVILREDVRCDGVILAIINTQVQAGKPSSGTSGGHSRTRHMVELDGPSCV